MSREVKVIDRSGDWFINTALFRFVDGDTGNTFEPGLPTKVNATAWMKSQPLIKSCPDPLNSDDPMPPQITPDSIKPELSDEDLAAAAARKAAGTNSKKK